MTYENTYWGRDENFLASLLPGHICAGWTMPSKKSEDFFQTALHLKSRRKSKIENFGAVKNANFAETLLPGLPKHAFCCKPKNVEIPAL